MIKNLQKFKVSFCIYLVPPSSPALLSVLLLRLQNTPLYKSPLSPWLRKFISCITDKLIIKT